LIEKGISNMINKTTFTRKVALRAMLVAAVGLFGAGVANAGCPDKGVISRVLYGSKEQVLKEVHKLNEPLGAKRVYMMILESADAAEIVYFENDQFSGSTKIAWKGRTASDLRAQLDKIILESRGKECAGEEAKQLILGLKKNVTVEKVPAPTTLSAAFIATLDTQAAGYYRATIVCPCE